MSKLFRPVSYPRRFVIRQRLRGEPTGGMSFQTRGRSENMHPLNRIFYRLHVLACHSGDTIVKQWMPAYRNFYRTHIGYGHQSMRYANTFSHGGKL